MRKVHTPSRASTYWQILSFLELDIRSRAQALAKLGLLPTFFGQSITKVFSQKYHGDVTSRCLQNSQTKITAHQTSFC